MDVLSPSPRIASHRLSARGQSMLCRCGAAALASDCRVRRKPHGGRRQRRAWGWLGGG
jgi:hypothetical protein